MASAIVNFVDLPPMWHFDLCAYLRFADIMALRLCCSVLRINIGSRLEKLRVGRPKYYQALVVHLRMELDRAFSNCGFTMPLLKWTPECDVLYQKMDELSEVLLMAQFYRLDTGLVQERLDFNVDWSSIYNGVQYITDADNPASAVLRVVANPAQDKGILFDLTMVSNIFGTDRDQGCVAMVAKTLHTKDEEGLLPVNIQLISEVNGYARFQWARSHAFHLHGTMERIRNFIYWHTLGPFDHGQSYRPGIFNLV